jgi:chromosome segregation ATPase
MVPSRAHSMLARRRPRPRRRPWLPSAADIERLTRRVRSLSQRLEGIEDGVDRLDERLAALPGAVLEQRLAAIEESLDKVGREVEAIRKKLPATPPRGTEAKKPASPS